MDEKKPKKAYWICSIGPADIDRLPNGSDSPLRIAVADAFEELVNPKKGDLFDCWSGWRNDYDMVKRIQHITSLEVDSRRIEMIDAILDYEKFKEIERVYDDWLRYNKEVKEYVNPVLEK